MIKKKRWGIIALVTIMLSGIGFYFSIPTTLFKEVYSSVVFDRDGYLMGGHIAKDGQWRFPPIDSVPVKYKKALLMFEDEHFYWHPGVNPFSLMRASWQNIRSWETVSGGSTISMQVIRLSKPCSRNIWNKLIELVKALRLETVYSKEEIINTYASHAPFGGNVVGLEAASWRYFGRAPNTLSWSEAATLAVLPNAPGLVHPGRNRNQLFQKRNVLLLKLYEKGVIDSLEYSVSLVEPVFEQPDPLPMEAPHCLNYFQKNGFLRGKTTLQLGLQEKANDIIERHALQYKNNQIHNAAGLIIDNNAGEVLVYIGNTRSHDNEDNGNSVDVIQASRSTGSILKPFLYASALHQGLILPNCLLPDIPSYYRDFSPQNYTRTYDGAVRADEALSRSLNIPAVRLLDEYGIDRFLAQLKNIGFSTFSFGADHYGLSLILGGAEVNLWELAGAYSSMARTLNRFNSMSSVYCSSDWRAPSIQLTTQEDPKTDICIDESFVLNASSIYYTFSAMENVFRPEEETGWELYQDSRRIAWKTGTSFGHRDAWAVGVTPEYTVVIWVGNANGEGRPGLTGGTTASPIMFELFRMLPNTTWFDKPYDDMYKAGVCTKSGYLAAESCDELDTVYIPDVTYNDLACPYHQLIHLDEKRHYQVNSDCYEPSKMTHEKWFVLPPVMEWYYKHKHPFYKSLPPIKPGCSAYGEKSMEMIYPANLSKVLLPRNFQGETEKLVLRLSHRKNTAHVYWHIDDLFLGETFRFHEIEVSMTPGWHTITIVDDEGNELVKRIFCLNK